MLPDVTTESQHVMPKPPSAANANERDRSKPGARSCVPLCVDDMTAATPARPPFALAPNPWQTRVESAFQATLLLGASLDSTQYYVGVGLPEEKQHLRNSYDYIVRL